MKKPFYLLPTLFFFNFFTGSAQDVPEEFKPLEKEWGVALEAVGIRPIFENAVKGVFDSVTLLIKYNKDGFFVYRTRIGFNFNNSKTGSESGLDSNKVTQTIKESQPGIRITPGLEYHFAGTRRLDPFVGVQLPIDFQGKHKVVDSYTSKSYKEVETTTSPGTFGIGLELLTGFNIYVMDRFSIGLEYSLGFRRVSKGGKMVSVTVEDGKETSRSESTVIDAQTTVVNRGVGAVSLTYFFGK